MKRKKRKQAGVHSDTEIAEKKPESKQQKTDHEANEGKQSPVDNAPQLEDDIHITKAEEVELSTTAKKKKGTLLDALAWLLESNASPCTAVCIVNNGLLIADNTIHARTGSGTKGGGSTDATRHIYNIMEYFTRCAERESKSPSKPNLSLEKKNLLVQVCLSKFKSVAWGQALKGLNQEERERIIEHCLDNSQLNTLIENILNDAHSHEKRKQLSKKLDRCVGGIVGSLFGKIRHGDGEIRHAVGLIVKTLRRFKRIENDLKRQESPLRQSLQKNPNKIPKTATSKRANTDSDAFPKIGFSEYGDIRCKDYCWLRDSKQNGYRIVCSHRGEDKVHAEMKIIDCLFAAELLPSEGVPEEGYFLGISKQCCFNCHALIKAVNACLSEERVSVNFTAAHNIDFDDWKPPAFLSSQAQKKKHPPKLNNVSHYRLTKERSGRNRIEVCSHQTGDKTGNGIYVRRCGEDFREKLNEKYKEQLEVLTPAHGETMSQLTDRGLSTDEYSTSTFEAASEIDLPTDVAAEKEARKFGEYMDNFLLALLDKHSSVSNKTKQKIGRNLLEMMEAGCQDIVQKLFPGQSQSSILATVSDSSPSKKDLSLDSILLARGDLSGTVPTVGGTPKDRDYVFENRKKDIYQRQKQKVAGKFNVEGLKFEPIKKDGHCLYVAVGLYLGIDVAMLRHQVAEKIKGNMETYRVLIPELAGGKTVEDYLHDIEHSNEWADHFEITILMQLYKRPIVVLDSQNGHIRNTVDCGQYPGKEPIFVFYNGHTHYDALILDAGTKLSGLEILTKLRAKEEEFAYLDVMEDEEGDSPRLTTFQTTKNIFFKELQKAYKEELTQEKFDQFQNQFEEMISSVHQLIQRREELIDKKQYDRKEEIDEKHKLTEILADFSQSLIRHMKSSHTLLGEEYRNLAEKINVLSSCLKDKSAADKVNSLKSLVKPFYRAVMDKKLADGGRKRGVVDDRGDCFFESVARGLKGLGMRQDSGENYTIEALRHICAHYVGNLSLGDNWVVQFVQGRGLEGWQDYKSRIGLLCSEENKDPIWGQVELEGRILMKKLGINIRQVSLEEGSLDATPTGFIEQDSFYLFDEEGKFVTASFNEDMRDRYKVVEIFLYDGKHVEPIEENSQVPRHATVTGIGVDVRTAEQDSTSEQSGSSEPASKRRRLLESPDSDNKSTVQRDGQLSSPALAGMLREQVRRRDTDSDSPMDDAFDSAGEDNASAASPK